MLKEAISLLTKSLTEHASQTDVKRLFEKKDIFIEVDLFDDESVDIYNLLLRTFSSKLFLSNQPGKNFLFFLFTLDKMFVESIHQFIKTQLLFEDMYSYANVYGQIYYKAWKQSEGVIKLNIELNCIQV
jgi:hypothetical protein